MATPALEPTPDLERRRRYTRWRRSALQLRALLLVGLPFVLVPSGFSAWLRDAAEALSSNYFAQLTVYALVTAACIDAVVMAGAAATYGVERKFGTARQTFTRWLRDAAKSALVVTALLMAWFYIVYVALRVGGAWWWLWAAAALSAALALYVFVFPTLVLPFHYRLEPLGDGALRQRILELMQRAGVRLGEVRRWHVGERTNKANAVVCGFGRSRAVLVSDTLLEACSEDEVAALVAHEIGHTALSHVAKRVVAMSLCIAGALGFAWLLDVGGLLAFVHGGGIADLANAPVLAFAMGAGFVYSFFFVARLYRRQERQADAYGWNLAPELVPAFISALAKIDALNLLYFDKKQESKYTHPATEGRIEAARNFLQQSGRPA